MSGPLSSTADPSIYCSDLLFYTTMTHPHCPDPLFFNALVQRSSFPCSIPSLAGSSFPPFHHLYCPGPLSRSALPLMSYVNVLIHPITALFHFLHTKLHTVLTHKHPLPWSTPLLGLHTLPYNCVPTFATVLIQPFPLPWSLLSTCLTLSCPALHTFLVHCTVPHQNCPVPPFPTTLADRYNPRQFPSPT